MATTPPIDKQGNVLDNERVYLVQRALIGSGWVCAPYHMDQDQVQEAINTQGWIEGYTPGDPPSSWQVLARTHDDPMRASPSLCNECSDTRRHWFVAGGITGLLFCFMEGEDTFKAEEQSPAFRTRHGFED